MSDASVTNHFDSEGQLRNFSLKTDWSLYKSILNNYFRINNIAEDQTKKIHFLNACDDEAYKLIVGLCLPQKLDSLSFKDLLELINRYFHPVNMEFIFRHKFYTAKKGSTESIEKWYIRIQNLASYCKFKNSELEVLVRDRFIMGLGNGPIMDRLFGENVLTLTMEKALCIALGMESMVYASTRCGIRSPMSEGTICVRNFHKSPNSTKSERNKEIDSEYANVNQPLNLKVGGNSTIMKQDDQVEEENDDTGGVIHVDDEEDEVIVISDDETTIPSDFVGIEMADKIDSLCSGNSFLKLNKFKQFVLQNGTDMGSITSSRISHYKDHGYKKVCTKSSNKLMTDRQEDNVHKCPHCDYKNKYAYHMKFHIMVRHTGADSKPFHCPQCDYKTLYPTVMKRHLMALHTGEKPHQCLLCNYRTRENHLLKRHVMARHTGEKPHRCRFCHFKTLWASSLKKHIISRHSGF